MKRLGAPLFVVAVIAIAACSGGNTGDDDDDDGASPTPVTIFSDDFAGGFPGTNWLAPNATLDTANGNAAPSLVVSQDVMRTNTANFPLVDGLSVSFELWYPMGMTWPNYGSPTEIVLTPVGAAFPRTSMSWFADGTLGTTVNLSFEIEIDGVSAPVVGNGGFNIDGNFHPIELRVTNGGAIGWYRDGILLVETAGYPIDGTTYLTLQHGSDLVARVDNVEIVGGITALPGSGAQ